MYYHSKVDSGSPGLDAMLDSIRLGDNVVWQTEDIADYAFFARRFARAAGTGGRRLVYFRFARHESILPELPPGAVQVDLDPAEGFERFTAKIHETATAEGLRAYYIFDSLSELADAWATDLMIGNFFVATCPYLFELETVAFFGILRNRHSSEAIARIRDTTQLFLELYRGGDELFIHPLKVWNRYSPTMFLPHRWSESECVPLTGAGEAAAFFTAIGPGAFRGSAGKLDSWDRSFLRAQELLLPGADPAEREAMKDELCSRLLCRDEKVVELAKREFDLWDLVAIRDRMVGSGSIGGKATGMLLARKIVRGHAAVLEGHDSFYIGSDVFYTYLVQNGLWKAKMAQRESEGYFSLAAPLREGLLKGVFPEAVKEQFHQILEYFGQSPIIIRSSSLLEDGFGNAFAGKYASLFRAGQGTPEKRYSLFEDAVREVYASMLDDSALAYRRRMGLDGLDEQMALLVQRVSGSFHGRYFFPLAAGVADSRNPWPWEAGMDRNAGLLRLVVGLGTRAVDRTGDDFPRLVALDDPAAHPWKDHDDLIRHGQRFVDVLDLKTDGPAEIPLEEVLALLDAPSAERVSERDREAESRLRDMGLPEREVRFVDFNAFLKEDGAAETFRSMLDELERAYGCPVDAEFTLNPPPQPSERGFRINLLQCRPLAHGRRKDATAGGEAAARDIAARAGAGRAIIRTASNAMGGPLAAEPRRLVYIPAAAYRSLSPSQRSSLSEAVRAANERIGAEGSGPAVLVTPGRCGSSTPELGLPIAFSGICNFSCIVEYADPAAGFMPELSFGSHFFRDLVEADILYAAAFAGSEGVAFDAAFLGTEAKESEAESPKVPEALRGAIRIMDFDPGQLLLWADDEGGMLLSLAKETS